MPGIDVRQQPPASPESPGRSSDRTPVARRASPEDSFDPRVRSDVATMRAQIVGERERHAVHSAPHEIVAHVLQDRCEQPSELGAARIIGRRTEERGEGAEQRPRDLRVEGLVRPRPNALHAESIGVHSHRRRREPGRRRREWCRRGKHRRCNAVRSRRGSAPSGCARSRHPSPSIVRCSRPSVLRRDARCTMPPSGKACENGNSGSINS